MAKGVDRLIEWCVAEISFADKQGYSIDDFALAFKRYFSDPDGKYVGEQQEEVAVRGRGPAAPRPAAVAEAADLASAAKAWTYVTSRPEISVGFDRTDRSWNHLGLEEIATLPVQPSISASSSGNQATKKPGVDESRAGRELAGPSSSPRQSNKPPELPQYQPRIYTSEQTTWMNITGHEIDRIRVPLCRWQLLLPLAIFKSTGLAQANLGRLAGHDPRSVPKRTDQLATAGYIVKRTVVIRGCKTSKLWLTRFAPPDIPNQRGPASWQRDLAMWPAALSSDLRPVAWCNRWTGSTIDYDAFGRTLLAVTKACRVIRPVELREKLGIQGNRWQTRVQRRLCRSWVGCGILGFVTATLGNGGKKFNDCIKFLRDPTEEEWKRITSTGGPKSKTKIKKAPKPAAAEGETRDRSGPGPVLSAHLSAWTPEKPLVNTVYESVKRAGQSGLSCPQISVLTTGYQFRRYMESKLSIVASSGAQPSHLGHLAIEDKIYEPRYHFFVAADDDRPPMPPETLDSISTRKLDVDAAQQAFGFAPIPESLAKTPADATLSSLARVSDKAVLLRCPDSKPTEPKPRPAPGKRRRWRTKPAEKAFSSATENAAAVAEKSTLNGNQGVASVPQDDGDMGPPQEEAPQEDEAAPAPLVAGARIGKPHSLRPSNRGRPPKRPSLVVIFTHEKLKDPNFLGGLSRGQPSPDEPMADVAASLRVAAPPPGPSSTQEKSAPGTGAGPDEVLTARYDGLGGQLRFSISDSRVTFEYDQSEKQTLCIPLRDVLDKPSIEIPPDGDDKALVINVSRNGSRWPYVFHFDNTADVCHSAIGFKKKLENIMGIASDAQPGDDPGADVDADAVGAAPRGRGKKRKGKQPALESFKCETCGAVYKNDLGLKYHLQKSQTSCNPNYVPPPIEEQLRKRRRVTYDGAADQDPGVEIHDVPTESGRGTTSRSLITPRPNNRRRSRPTGVGLNLQARRFGRKPLDLAVNAMAISRGIGLGRPTAAKDISASRQKKQEHEFLARVPLPDIDDRFAETPTFGRSGLPTNGGSVAGILESRPWRPKQFKQPKQSKRPKGPRQPKLKSQSNEPQDTAAPAPSRGSPLSGDARVVGNNVVVPEQPEAEGDGTGVSLAGYAEILAQLVFDQSMPKFQLPPEIVNGRIRTKTHQSVEVVKYLLKHNNGVFPGEKALWYAVGFMYAREFPNALPPTPRSLEQSMRLLLRRGLIKPYIGAWRDNKGSAATIHMIVRADMPESHPAVTLMKEAMQAAHPEVYIPALFSPPDRFRGFMDFLERGEQARMNPKGKRNRTSDVEILTAPFYQHAPGMHPAPRRMVPERDHHRELADNRVGNLSGSGLARAFLEIDEDDNPSGKRRRGAPPGKRHKTLHRVYGPNPGLQSLPRPFLCGAATVGDSAPWLNLQFLPSNTDLDRDNGSGVETVGNSPQTISSTASAGSVEERTTAPSPKTQATPTTLTFVEPTDLEDEPGSPGNYPSRDDKFFLKQGESFALRGWTPSARDFLVSSIPNSAEEIPSHGHYRLDGWADPGWAKFCPKIDACERWELSQDGSYLLMSGSVAPEYRFYNFGVDKDSGFTAHGAKPSPIWLDTNQFTLETLPYHAMAAEEIAEDSDLPAVGTLSGPDIRYKHVHFGADGVHSGSYRPRGSGRGRGGGGPGSRGGRVGRVGRVGRGGRGGRGGGFGGHIASEGSRPPTTTDVAAGHDSVRAVPLRRDVPITVPAPPEPKIDVYRHVRELTAFPHTAADYISNNPPEDNIDWTSDDTRIAAFVAVRTLLGGVDKTIDWGLLMRLFPDMKLSALRRFWTHIRKVRGYYIDATTEKFQEAFLEAYERGDLPALNYDDVLAYDWRRLVRWTLSLVVEDTVKLPGTREGVEREFEVDETAYRRPEWRETYFHFQRSVWNRFQDATSEPAALALDDEEVVGVVQQQQQPCVLTAAAAAAGNSSSSGHRDGISSSGVGSVKNATAIANAPLSGEARIATTWVRALCSTAPEHYSPITIMAKLRSAFGLRTPEEMQNLLVPVIHRLQNRRVICKSKATPLRGGRPYRYTKNFLTQLEKSSQAEKYTQAARFKTELDELFRSFSSSGSGSGSARKGKRVRSYDLPYGANDGTIMAILNMQARGRVRVEPYDAPYIPHGFEPGNYETRKFAKERYHFGIRVRPTAEYLFDEQIAVLGWAGAGRAPVPRRAGWGVVRGGGGGSGSGTVGSGGTRSEKSATPAMVYALPSWCNFLGEVDESRWAKISGAVFFVLSTRGSMDAETCARTLGPLVEREDVQAVMAWGERLGLVGDRWLSSASAAAGRAAGRSSSGRRNKEGTGPGVTVREWWWLVIGRQFERVMGIEKGKAKENVAPAPPTVPATAAGLTGLMGRAAVGGTGRQVDPVAIALGVV